MDVEYDRGIKCLWGCHAENASKIAFEDFKGDDHRDKKSVSAEL